MSADDLRAILGLREERFAAELAAHRLDKVREREIFRKARRSLRVRTGAMAVAAVAAVAVMTVGVWALMRGPEREPLITAPTPTAANESAPMTPTQTSSPAPMPDAPAFSTTVATGPGFLPASTMTAQLWSEVGDGWILSYWAPDAYKSGPYDAATYLQDPHGARYEISHFVEPGPWHIVSVGFWKPGDTFAVAQAGDIQDGIFGRESWGRLDLLSGEFVPLPVLEDAVWSLGTAQDGSYLFSTDAGPASGVLVVAPDLSSSRGWELAGGFAEGHLSPDGSAILDVPDGAAGTRTFTLRSSVDGTVLWSGSEATYGEGSNALGEEACAWGGWAGGSDLAILCTWYETGNYDVIFQTDVFRVDADGSERLASLSSGLHFGNVQPAGDGLVGEGIVNVAGADSGEVYYLDRPGLAPWPHRGAHGIWSTFMLAGDVEAVGWNAYGPGSAMARNLATGDVFDIAPAPVAGVGGTGSAFSLGVVLVGSPLSFQVQPGQAALS